ncbi:MAG TPA: hypothetical protein PK040_00130 [Anaerolineaceae bacterium]|nr:hypothetical protein [Anaerolineaceae bacterium]
MNEKRKILYIDMDNTLVDFKSGLKRVSPIYADFIERGKEDEIPGIFALMDPMPGAIEAYKTLSDHFDTYILSTAPWKNPTAWSDKLLWVQRYLEPEAHKRLILTPHKELNMGDFLVDDDFKDKAKDFRGELIKFGSDKFKDWKAVLDYLLPRT